ncbi:MAG TPA: GAF domain-containing protein [Firmicutes bacterium]|nr:GAF domain-containing protein [Candidatus Fermentithermobacillaceae bacterium]
MTGDLRDRLLARIKAASQESDDIEAFYRKVVDTLSRIPYYNWVGFYFLKGGELVLGPYVGKPTQHVRIKVGQGVCGRAVAERSTIVVDDVTKESNYLACSLETRSEIVVPIWVGDKIIGEIDIDSDELAAFDQIDKDFLEEVAAIVGDTIASSRK